MFHEYIYNSPMARGNMRGNVTTHGWDQFSNWTGNNWPGLIAIALGIFTIIALICLTVTVFMIVSQWFMFKKAKKEGWEAIVPVYNMIVLFQIAGVSPWLLLIYLVGWVPIVGWLAVLGLSIYHSIMLSKSFGKSVGFGVGIFFFPYVFYPIIAFSKNINYVKPGGEQMQSEVKIAEPVKTEGGNQKAEGGVKKEETVVEATPVEEVTEEKKEDK